MAFPVAFQVRAEMSLPCAIIFFFFPLSSFCLLQFPAWMNAEKVFSERSIKVFCKLLFIKFPFLDLTVYSVNKTALRTLGHGTAVFKPSFTSCQWWQQHVARVSPLPSLTETHISAVSGVLRVPGSSRGVLQALLGGRCQAKGRQLLLRCCGTEHILYPALQWQH